MYCSSIILNQLLTFKCADIISGVSSYSPKAFGRPGPIILAQMSYTAIPQQITIYIAIFGDIILVEWRASWCQPEQVLQFNSPTAISGEDSRMENKIGMIA